MPIGRRRPGVRVRHKIRRIELWPALKIAFLFHLACYLISLVVLVASWSLLTKAGFIDKVSNFLIKIGFADGLTISGPVLFRGAASVGAALVIHNTIVTFLLVLLYNLFSGMFGGVIISVIEERPPGSPRPQGLDATEALPLRSRRTKSVPQAKAPKVRPSKPATGAASGGRSTSPVADVTDETDLYREDEDWLQRLDDPSGSTPRPR